MPYPHLILFKLTLSDIEYPSLIADSDFNWQLRKHEIWVTLLEYRFDFIHQV